MGANEGVLGSRRPPDGGEEGDSFYHVPVQSATGYSLGMASSCQGKFIFHGG